MKLTHYMGTKQSRIRQSTPAWNTYVMLFDHESRIMFLYTYTLKHSGNSPATGDYILAPWGITWLHDSCRKMVSTFHIYFLFTLIACHFIFFDVNTRGAERLHLKIAFSFWNQGSIRGHTWYCVWGHELLVSLTFAYYSRRCWFEAHEVQDTMEGL